MSTRANLRLADGDAQGPPDLIVAPAQWEQNLDHLRDTAVGQALEAQPRGTEKAVLAAKMTGALKDWMGSEETIKQHAGSRPAYYRRRQLLLDDPLTVHDEAQLAIDAPAGMVMYVSDLLLVLAEEAPVETGELLNRVAGKLGCSVTALEPAAIEMGRAIGHSAQADAALIQAHAEALSPDSPGGSRITLDELRELKHAARVKREAAELAESAVRRAELAYPGARA